MRPSSKPLAQAMGGCERASQVPCVLISKEQGAALKRALVNGEVVEIDLRAHPAVAKARTMEAQLREFRARAGDCDAPLSCHYGRGPFLRSFLGARRGRESP